MGDQSRFAFAGTIKLYWFIRVVSACEISDSGHVVGTTHPHSRIPRTSRAASKLISFPKQMLLGFLLCHMCTGDERVGIRSTATSVHFRNHVLNVETANNDTLTMISTKADPGPFLVAQNAADTKDVAWEEAGVTTRFTFPCWRCDLLRSTGISCHLGSGEKPTRHTKPGQANCAALLQVASTNVHEHRS